MSFINVGSVLMSPKFVGGDLDWEVIVEDTEEVNPRQ